MPSAPLFYTPIMQAQIRSIPVGKTTLGAIEDAQLRYSKVVGADGSASLAPETTGAQQAAQGEQGLGIAGSVSGSLRKPAIGVEEDGAARRSCSRFERGGGASGDSDASRSSDARNRSASRANTRRSFSSSKAPERKFSWLAFSSSRRIR